MNIPNEFHFIFGLTPDHGGKPFSFVHYLAIVMCHEVNRPNSINMYYAFEPSSIWWDRARQYINAVKISPPQEIFGNPIRHPAHMADVIRLEVLLKHGGIYLDIDVLCLRPFTALRDFNVVLGEELNVGLCNAVILAKPGASFLRRWLSEYKTFSAEDWNKHSVQMPKLLTERYPSEIHVVDHTNFFSPTYSEYQLKSFFLGEGSNYCENSYCVHLWQTFTWFRLKDVQPSDLLRSNSEFALLTKPYLDANVVDIISE